jgi:hypothetical protein
MFYAMIDLSDSSDAVLDLSVSSSWLVIGLLSHEQKRGKEDQNKCYYV